MHEASSLLSEEEVRQWRGSSTIVQPLRAASGKADLALLAEARRRAPGRPPGPAGAPARLLAAGGP